MFRTLECWRRLIALTMLVVGAGAAAQAPTVGGGAAMSEIPGAPGGPVAPGIPGEAGAAGEVDVQIDSFGVGGVARPGDYAGLRVTLLDRGGRVRAVVVRLRLRDPDGDIALIDRAVTLNPGVRQSTWLYARLPFSLASGDVMTLTVHETDDSDALEAAVGGAGRQIGAVRIAPDVLVGASDGLIGVVGRSRMGLEDYSTRSLSAPDQPATAHEAVELVMDLSPGSLPDAWMGLAAMEAIVWTVGEPAELRTEAANAVREWVHRGGQLIVVLPEFGQTWTNERNNPLFDITPAVLIDRDEQAALAPLAPLLSGAEGVSDGVTGVLQTFRPAPEAGPLDAMPILAAPDGRPLAVRRIVGTGCVTLVGVNLTDRTLAGRIDAQRIWHRLLGKRFDVLSTADVAQLSRSGRNVNFHFRDTAYIDTDIPGQINKTGRVGVGLLLAIVVFGAYWAVAGFGSWVVLKARKMSRHAWLSFVAATALFTLIAWGGATIIRPSEVDITHLTLLQHVYGQPVQRTRTWFSVLLPEYGQETVSVGDPAEAGRWRDVLTAWDDPSSLGRDSFPDARGYSVDARRPGSLTVPTRSTVKQFQADWLGGPRWKMPTPGPDGIVVDERGQMQGVLTHGMPAALEDVTIVRVRQQVPLHDLRQGGPLLADAWAWQLPEPWAPGAPLDLTVAAPAQGGSINRAETHFEGMAQNTRALGLGIGGDGGRGDALERLGMIPWASVLAPPDYTDLRATNSPFLKRRASHTWDLGVWFTQPSLLIVGHVVGAESPTPLRVGGQEAPESGRTLVSWVYPLPPAPPRFPGADGGEDRAGWR